MKNTILTPYHYVESGLAITYLEKVDGLVCGRCKEQMAILPSAEKLSRVIAERLLQKRSLLCGEEVCFLRKYAFGVSVRDAHMVPIHPQALIEIEQDRTEITLMQDIHYRLAVIRKLGYFKNNDHILKVLLGAFALINERAKIRSEIILIGQEEYKNTITL